MLKDECISKIKDTIENPLDYENVFKRNELGDPQKYPKRKRPPTCETLSSKKYLIPRKNISNAKQNKLSNHRQEHPTKKIENLYENLFIQISRAKSAKFLDGTQ